MWTSVMWPPAFATTASVSTSLEPSRVSAGQASCGSPFEFCGHFLLAFTREFGHWTDIDSERSCICIIADQFCNTGQITFWYHRFAFPVKSKQIFLTFCHHLVNGIWWFALSGHFPNTKFPSLLTELALWMQYASISVGNLVVFFLN